MRNPYFLPSGFEEQEKVAIIEAKGDNRKRLDKIKGRKRAEKKLRKQAKYATELDRRANEIYDTMIKARKNMTTIPKIDQIQYGFDLVKWWGEQHE